MGDRNIASQQFVNQLRGEWIDWEGSGLGLVVGV